MTKNLAYLLFVMRTISEESSSNTENKRLKVEILLFYNYFFNGCTFE